MKNKRGLFVAFALGESWYSDDEAYSLKEFNGVLFLCEDVNYYNKKTSEFVKIGQAYRNTGKTDSHGDDIYEGDKDEIGNFVAWNPLEFRWSVYDGDLASSRKVYDLASFCGAVSGNIHKEDIERLKNQQ